MGDRSIKKREAKKPKADKKGATIAPAIKTAAPLPPLVKETKNK